MSERAFILNGLFLIVVLICGSNAALRTLYMEELCYGTSFTKLDTRFQNSAILASVPSGPMECEIRIEPERDDTLVIAFYKYSLGSSDQLVFRDPNNFELSLSGEATFLDERKSLFFEGPLTIYYSTNSTYGPSRLKFQLVYTQVHDGPCDWDEYKCRNNKCIPKNLACDKHNHCGDISDQEDCSLKEEASLHDDRVVITTYKNPWIVSIIVCAVILAIVLIAFAAVAIQGRVQKNKKAQQPQLTTVAVTHSIQHVAPPSVLGRVQNSFRRVRQTDASQHAPAPAHQVSKNYQVPSMYPQMPSAPQLEGVDNPEFKADE